MNKTDFEFYKTLSRATQKGLLNWVKIYLTGIYTADRVVATKDYVYAIGDTPIALVSHLDTVHLTAPVDIYYDRDQQVIWSPQGLGADDRAGVYAIFKILSNGHRPHVLFTTNEEIGGLGAQAAAKQLKPDVNFIIELDRRGQDDSVFYDLDNIQFENYINSYGFVTDFGSFSDICYLCPKWGMAGVNLSIGYEKEHTKAEHLSVFNMTATIQKVQEMITELKIEEDKFDYVELSATKGEEDYLRFLGGYEDYDFNHGRDSRAAEVCYGCFKGFSNEFLIDMGKDGKYCGECYPKIFTTCTKCGKAFIDKNKTEEICQVCKGAI